MKLLEKNEVEMSGYRGKVNQYFAVLTNMNTVGVKNGERTYLFTVALRAVITENFVTAKAAPFDFEFLHGTARRIVSEIPAVSRVLYDVTDKPTGTIEFE